MGGYVYILANQSMPGLLKVGRTNDIDRRIKELSQATGVPTPFVLVHEWMIIDENSNETAAHEALSDYRVEKEFFRLPMSQAVEIVGRVMVGRIVESDGEDFTDDEFWENYEYDIENPIDHLFEN